MNHILFLTVVQYLHNLLSYVLRQWNQMTPAQYGGVLISIGVVGYLLMKSSTKKS
jgi:hypothetical protein